MLSQSEIIDEFNLFLRNYERHPQLKIFEFAMDRKFANFLARFIHWTPSQIMQYANVASFYQKVMTQDDFIFGQVKVFDSNNRIYVSINYKNIGEFKRDGSAGEFYYDFEEAYNTVLKAIKDTIHSDIDSFTKFLEYCEKDTVQLICSRFKANNIHYINQLEFNERYQNLAYDKLYTSINKETFKTVIHDLILDKKSVRLIMQIFSLGMLDNSINYLDDDLISLRFYDDFTSFMNVNKVLSFTFGSCFTDGRCYLTITDSNKPFQVYIPDNGCDEYGDDHVFEDLEEAYQFLLKSVVQQIAAPLNVEPSQLTIKDVLLYQMLQY